MKKAKQIVSLAMFATFIGGNFVSFADVPTGSAILGSKGYTLEYVNDQKNKVEIAEILRSNERVLIKSHDGAWYDNITGEAVEEYAVPEIKYLNDKGSIVHYKEEDGDKINFNLDKINYVSKDTISIAFTSPFKDEDIKHKENYIVNGKALSEKDKIEFTEDSKGIIITLDEAIKDENFNSKIVLKNIYDENGEHKEDISKDIFVITKPCKAASTEGDINIIGNNIELEDLKVSGDIYVSGSGVILKDAETKGNIILTNIKSGKVLLDNCQAENLNIEKNNEIDKLVLKGTMNVYNKEEKSVKDFDLYSKSKDKEILLKGDFSKINIKSQGKINISSNTNIGKLNVEDNIKLLGHKSSEIEHLNVAKGIKIDKDAKMSLNVAKESTIDINTKAKSNPSPSVGVPNFSGVSSTSTISTGSKSTGNGNGSTGTNTNSDQKNGSNVENNKPKDKVNLVKGSFIDNKKSKIIEVEGTIYAVVALKTGNISDYKFYLNKEEIQCKKVNTSGTIVKFELENNKEHEILVKSNEAQDSIKLSV